MSVHVTDIPIVVDPLIDEANRRKRRRRIFLAAALVVAGVVAVALVLALPPRGPHSSPTAGSPGTSGARASQAEARIRADSLLRKVPLPPGAKRVSAQMAGAAAAGQNYGTDPFTQYEYRSGFWQVHEPLPAIIAFLKQHPPRDFIFRFEGYGATGPYQGVLFTGGSTSIGGHEPSRILVSVVQPHGATILRVDAGVPWTVPRSPSQMLPATVREVDIHSPFAPKRPTHHVSDPRDVALITRWFNDLNVLQLNTTVLCANGADAWVHFTFRSASGAELASALVPAGPASSCTEIGFMLHGRQQTPLVDSTPENHLDFIDRVQRLLGGVLFGPRRRPY